METETNIENPKDMAVYEVSYIFLPTISPEQVLEKVAGLKNVFQKAGAELISDENPVLIDLTYQMTKVFSTIRHKADSGYFGWMKFEIIKEGMVEVKKQLDLNEDILRYIVVHTVKENTLLEGKMKLHKEEKIRKTDDSDVKEVEEVDIVPPVEAVSADLDKSIDDLVIV